MLAVLPGLDAEAVARALQDTRSVNVTIERALAGMLPQAAPKRSPEVESLTMEQRKQRMVDEARRWVG